MRDATLVFLVKRSEGKIAEVCLAMKKRGFGKGRWNGAGGKVAVGEKIEEAAVRETEEEICVTPENLNKCAELAFTFPHKSEWDQKVHVFLSERWHGEPKESEEMAPKWFNVADIPYKEMWPDDPMWLPQVLHGKRVCAAFTFGENDIVVDHQVEFVEKLA